MNEINRGCPLLVWGGLAKVTYPDATWISYSHDPAHRLIGIADSAGHRVDYILDNAGNRT
ncbi:MAG: RHS repeat domain-containing protein [Sulfuricellaceae bacterium]|nr:RHS repeat domain-containing protein [Sulfuricellaceae bacterium]